MVNLDAKVNEHFDLEGEGKTLFDCIKYWSYQRRIAIPFTDLVESEGKIDTESVAKYADLKVQLKQFIPKGEVAHYYAATTK